MLAFDNGHEESYRTVRMGLCHSGVLCSSRFNASPGVSMPNNSVWLLLHYSVGAEEDSLMGLHLDCLAVKS